MTLRKDAIYEGKCAAQCGWSKSRNPFPKPGSLHNAWLEGWKIGNESRVTLWKRIKANVAAMFK